MNTEVETKEPHLWEVNHLYHCSETNYYASGGPTRFRNFSEFLEEYAEADQDMNLVFRWDWNEGEDYGLPEFNGDINYRNGLLTVFYMGQREGQYWAVEIEVCRADEPQVRDFLEGKYEYLKTLWTPF